MHCVAHKLADGGCPKDISAEAYYRLTVITEQIDCSREIVNRMLVNKLTEILL